MTANPPGTPGSSQTSPAGSGLFQALRRSGVWRAPDRWLGGVCSGIAARLGWDPLLVRGLFIFLALITAGGGALALYGLAWLLLPEASDGRIHLEQVFSGHWAAGFLGAIIMVFIGVTSGVTWSVFSPGLGVFSGLVIAGLLVAILVMATNRRTQGPTTQPSWASSPPTNQPPSSPASSPAPAAWSTPASGPGPAAWSAPNPGSAPAGSPPNPAGPPWTGGQPGPAPGGTVPPGPGQPVPPAGGSGPTWTTPPPPRRRAGGPVSLALVGLMALCIASLVALDRYTTWFTNWLTPGLAIGTVMVLMGLGLMLLGLLGRRAGGFLAASIVLVILAGPIVAGADAVKAGGGTITVGERTYVPRSIDRDVLFYGLSIGKMTVDLTELQIPKGEVAEVEIAVSMGQANVILPDQTAIELDVQVNAGVVATHGLDPGWQFDDLATRGISITTGRGGWDNGWNRSNDGLQGLGVHVIGVSPTAVNNKPSLVVTITTSMGQVDLMEHPGRLVTPIPPIPPIPPAERT